MDRGRLNKKISPALGGRVGEGLSSRKNGAANIAEASTSTATGRLRHATAQLGPTSPSRQKSRDSSAVRMIRKMVARLATPVACPPYIATK